MASSAKSFAFWGRHPAEAKRFGKRAEPLRDGWLVGVAASAINGTEYRPRIVGIHEAHGP